MDDVNKISDRLNEYLKSLSREQIETASQANAEEEIDLDRKQERAFKEEDITNKKYHNNILRENAILRKQYSTKIFTFTCIWTSSIIAIIIIQGFCIKNFFLSDKVLIVLISTTTINVFGFFLLVVKYLFHVESPIKNKRNKEK